MNLSDRQLATILAALRHWQSHVTRWEDEEFCGGGHFYSVEPLTNEEIDELCEDLNTEEDE